MRKKLAVLFGIAFAIACFITPGSTPAKAAYDGTATPIKLVRVTDIDAETDYGSNYNEIKINTQNYSWQDGEGIYKMVLEEDSYVKLLISARNLDKIQIKSGNSTINAANVTATVYRDSKLYYPVMPAVTATGDKAGISVQKYALDKGTYYIAIRTDRYSSSSSSTIYVDGTAEFIVYYQQLASNETYRPSSKGKENLITLGSKFRGVLTIPNPKDYYMFELKERALLKINFMYDSKNNAKFILYGSDRQELMNRTFQGNNVENSVLKYLERGIYYCSVETVAKDDGGSTVLQLSQTVYPLELKQINTTTNSYINVETIAYPKEVRYIKGDLSSYEISGSKWNNGKVITNEMKFGVNETGVYTVRVTDEYNNMFIETIKVTKCDTKAPKKPTIKSYAAGSIIISGTAEKNTDIIITINNKQYTCTADDKGNYSCDLNNVLAKGNKIEVYSRDISGNISAKAVALVQ